MLSPKRILLSLGWIVAVLGMLLLVMLANGTITVGDFIDAL